MEDNINDSLNLIVRGKNSFTEVHLGKLSLYFSYGTLIAISSEKHGRFISKNYWGTTTGKHLNSIDCDQSIRIEREDFDKIVKRIIKHHRLI